MATERQHAALPYVVCNGEVEVLLITSRDTQRWVIPKGWPKKKMTAYELAALEAYEEAGLQGEIDEVALGDYHYIKRLKGDEETLVRVDVYPLLVESQLLDWPEKGQRQLNWVRPEQAARMVDEKELSLLLKVFRAEKAKNPRAGLVSSVTNAVKRLLIRAV